MIKAHHSTVAPRPTADSEFLTSGGAVNPTRSASVGRVYARIGDLAMTLLHRADRHPLAADAALVALMLIATAPDAIRRGEATPVTIGFHFTLWLPVVFRRRHPVLVFGVVAAVALVQWFVGVEVAADLALLVSLYTVAAHRGRAVAVSAALILEVGVVLAAIKWGNEDGAVRTFVQLSGVTLAALLSGIVMQNRNAGFAELRDRAVRAEQERDQQARFAAAAERTRIAREMHDIVAHSLSVMITLADGAALTEHQADARAAMQQVSRTGRDALADTRRVLGVLRRDDGIAELAPQPELSTLDSLLTAVRATGLRVEMVTRGAPFSPTPTAQAAVYRIVQEAMTNTVKHSVGASTISIVLSYARPYLEINVSDNGTVAITDNAHAGGHGLAGMRERAAVFGGTLLAGPGRSGGWEVSTTLTLDGPA